jgi:hypothetical protein
MFDFTLSKINMLIFVTAIAVVVIFFMNTLNDNLKTRQSYELAFKIGKEIKSVIDSDSYCSIKFIDIPKTIRVKEGSNLSGIPYKLGFQSYAQFDNKSLVIYLSDIKEENILGAYNLDYNGTINFYSSEYNNAEYDFENESSNEFIYYPRKESSNETKYLIIKQIIDNENSYNVIPCEKKYGKYSCKKHVCQDNETLKEISCLTDFCSQSMEDETL